MALTIAEGLAATATAAGGTTVTHDVTDPGGTSALLVAVVIANPSADAVTATYGGVSMDLAVSGSTGVRLFELLDLSGVASDDLVVSKPWYFDIGVQAAWLSGGTVVRLDEDGTAGSVPGSASVSLNPAGATGCLAFVCGAGARSGGLSTSDISDLSGAGQTELSEVFIPVGVHGAAMHVAYKAGVGASQSYGTTTSGAVGTMHHVAAALYDIDSGPPVEPAERVLHRFRGMEEARDLGLLEGSPDLRLALAMSGFSYTLNAIHVSDVTLDEFDGSGYSRYDCENVATGWDTVTKRRVWTCDNGAGDEFGSNVDAGSEAPVALVVILHVDGDPDNDYILGVSNVGTFRDGNGGPLGLTLRDDIVLLSSMEV